MTTAMKPKIFAFPVTRMFSPFIYEPLHTPGKDVLYALSVPFADIPEALADLIPERMDQSRKKWRERRESGRTMTIDVPSVFLSSKLRPVISETKGREEALWRACEDAARYQGFLKSDILSGIPAGLAISVSEAPARPPHIRNVADGRYVFLEGVRFCLEEVEKSIKKKTEEIFTDLT